MTKREIFLAMFSLLVFCAFIGTASAAAFYVPDEPFENYVTASAMTWYVDDDGGADFTVIQDAINNAKDGDTILVYSGVYYENVVVDKSVTLMGNGHPVVDAGGRGSVITLTADGITLVGFTATNSGSWPLSDAGIEVTSNNNIITGNKASNNYWQGIRLSYSSNNNITGNDVWSNNWDGIRLRHSSNNTITGNNASNNNDRGICLSDSSNNTITGNNASNNGDGIMLHGSSKNIITGNNASSNRRYGIFLCDSSNNTITGNNVSNNDHGIYLTYSSSDRASSKRKGIYLTYSSNNNTITGNNVRNNNWEGICLFDSSNNTITGNNVSNNDDGIYLYNSSNNKICLDNFIDNSDNVKTYKSTPPFRSNIWNSEEEITYTFNGNTYESYLGNYWDDYEGTDADGDGIGDTPYGIRWDKDNYPLIKPCENYIISIPTPT